MRTLFEIILIKLEHALFLLLIFFLPTQLGKHFWPDFSVVSGLRIDYLSPTLYFTDVIIVLLFLVKVINWLCFGGGVKASIRKLNECFGQLSSVDKSTKDLKRFLFYVVFIASLTVSISLSSSPENGAFGLLKFVEFVFFGWIASKMLQSGKIFKQTILVFSSSMLLQSLLAIAQFLNQASINGLFYYLGERMFTSITPGVANASLNGALVLRPYGTLPHPNVLGGYLLMGLVLMISSYKNFLQKWERWFLSLAIFLSSVVLFLTMSRTSIFVGLLLFVVYFGRLCLSDKSSRKRHFGFLKIFVAVLGLSVFGSILLRSSVIYRFFSISIADESVVQRIDLLIASLRMFMDHPVLGVGLSNFLIQLPNYASLSQVPIQPVHNIYLLILAESGIIVLSFVSVFIFAVFSRLRSSSHSAGYLGMILIAILLLGLNDHYLLTLQQGKLLLTLSISIIYARSGSTFGLKRGKFNRNKLIQSISELGF